MKDDDELEYDYGPYAELDEYDMPLEEALQINIDEENVIHFDLYSVEDREYRNAFTVTINEYLWDAPCDQLEAFLLESLELLDLDNSVRIGPTDTGETVH